MDTTLFITETVDSRMLAVICLTMITFTSKSNSSYLVNILYILKLIIRIMILFRKYKVRVALFWFCKCIF